MVRLPMNGVRVAVALVAVLAGIAVATGGAVAAPASDDDPEVNACAFYVDVDTEDPTDSEVRFVPIGCAVNPDPPEKTIPVSAVATDDPDVNTCGLYIDVDRQNPEDSTVRYAPIFCDPSVKDE